MRRHIHLASGFLPGKVYQVVYTTTGAPVIGLGLIATRDMVSFLRYGVSSGGQSVCGAYPIRLQLRPLAERQIPAPLPVCWG